MDGITQLTPDGYNVTMTGRILTIHGLDPSMQGKIVCKLVSSCTKTRGDVDLGFLLPIPPKGAYICIKTAIDCWNKKHYLLLASLTSNNQRLGSASDVTRLSLLCQVGDDVIRPCKICGGCQIRVPRSIRSISCPMQPRVQSVLGVRSFYVERN